MLDSEIDWGCPNWRNTTQYGDVTQWVERRWRWEFKRRTQKYRSGYQYLLDRYWRELHPLNQNFTNLMWRPECKRVLIPLTSAEAAKFAFSPLPNPLYSEALEWSDEKYSSHGAGTLDNRTLQQFDIYRQSQQLPGDADVLGPGQVAIVFDPNSPIQPQLDGIREHLEKFRHHSIKPMSRKHTDKWFRYLRILDAREQGASWSECASVLPRDIIETPQAATDTYRAAVKTRDSL